jgi:hypothetical protein
MCFLFKGNIETPFGNIQETAQLMMKALVTCKYAKNFPTGDAHIKAVLKFS